MPPPKRPFTTSSLTSTLKSTIANQPLLSNLTNIDKLSSQATSLAQRTPFFANLQHHPNQHQDAGHLTAPATTTTTTNTSSNNKNNFAANDANMMRAGNNNNFAGDHHPPMVGANNQAQQQQRPPMASTPTVDMSHLTEEERLMIQSVIAKAEMADMGMPVDTSAPSSTNLPSNASQALVQAEKAKQQQNRQQMNLSQNQSQQGGPGGPNGGGMALGFQNQKSQQMNQQEFMQQQNQHQQQQQQQYQQGLLQLQMNPNMTIQDTNIQNQPSYQSKNDPPLMNLTNSQSQFNQVQQRQPQLPLNQNMQIQPTQMTQANNIDFQQANMKQQSMLDSRNTNLPSIEQQTQLLVNQINSQFNLGQNQEQQPLQKPQQPLSQLTNQYSQNINQLQMNNNQQQQRQQQLEQQTMRDQQAVQQTQLQQIPAMSSFDQSLLAQTQGLVGMNTQIQNPISQQQINNQSLLQQQPQQTVVNSMINDQNRMPQAYQADYNINSQSALLNNQAASSSLMQQQTPGKVMQHQVGLNDFNNNMLGQMHQLNQINQTNPNNACIKRVEQLSSAENSVDSMFLAQQRQFDLQGNNLMQPNSVNSTTQQTSGQNFNNEILRSNNPPSHSAYNDHRSEIRFRTQQMSLDNDYNDHAFSDQEYYENRPQHQNSSLRRHDSADQNSRRVPRHPKYLDGNEQSVDMHGRNLQVYDLAQRGEQNNLTRPKTKLRQLPQPNLHHDKSPQSSTEHIQTDRQHSKFRDSGKHTKVVKKTSNSREIKHEIPQQPTDSEEDEGGIYSSGEKKNAELPVSASKRKSPNLLGKETTDKNDDTLRILSELKLSEQANQVMEQQQLLIKQSQELIKLQLEQQALSQELKKSIKQNSSANSNANSEQPSSEKKDLSNQEADVITDNVKVESSYKGEADDELDGNQRDQVTSRKLEESGKLREDDVLPRSSRFEQTKKSTSFCHDHDSDIDDENPRATSKSTSRKFIDLSDENAGYGDRKGHLIEKEKVNRKVGTNPSNLAPLTASPRYNRDVFQSPTDTTDSDVESITHASMRRQQRLLQSKLKPLVRRREPTGLPPSPLPVAAAIQLHQMQQQHLKNIGQVNSARGNLRRSNFMRSRSVTSSPNHQLDYTNSGYMTDNQRIRSTSPDTLSEFGGQRRRKRLPEPPTNAVPITPSMVRKMIQTQRSGNSHGKLLASVNAKTTSLTNTHSNRQLTFERQGMNDSDSVTRSSSNRNDPTQISSVLNQTSYSTDHPVSNLSNSSQIGGSSMAKTTMAASRAPELNKFLSSTYGNSILRNNISDIKDTPELDKMISNLDNYYGLDNKHNSSRPDAPSVSDAYNLGSITRTPAITTSSILLPNRTLTQNYPSYTSRPTSTTLTRCNSEGEGYLTPRFIRKNYLHSTNLDDYKSYGRNLGTSSYLDGTRSIYMPSSLTRQGNMPSSGLADTSTTQPDSEALFGTSSALGSKFDRPYQHYRPTQNQYRLGSRLQNLSGSFDNENSDNLTSTAIHEHQRPFSSIMSESSNKYQTRPYVSGNADTLKEKYRYSEIPQDLSSYSNKISNNITYPYSSMSEFGEQRGTYSSTQPSLRQFQHRSLDFSDSRTAYPNNQCPTYEPRFRGLRSNQYSDSTIPAEPSRYSSNRVRYSTSPSRYLSNESSRQKFYSGSETTRPNYESSSFAPLTKNDIINSGPKFNSIGYRFRTENQNKYVAQARTPIQCLQSRYPHPYKRILLSKNPKDRIGNGIGVRITGGQPIPSLYDKVNKCIITSGAFVTEVFQDSNVYFMGELHEGDQIIEWNGVNLCNRSDEEVQQILLSQLSDEEVEIIYLQISKFNEAYEEVDADVYQDQKYEQDIFDTFADMNKSGHQSVTSPNIIPRGRYGVAKGSIRRKMSLSSIAHMWSR